MANKNQALAWVINEEDNNLYLSTVYGLIDVSKIVYMQDCSLENKNEADIDIKLKAIKWSQE